MHKAKFTHFTQLLYAIIYLKKQTLFTAMYELLILHAHYLRIVYK